MLPLLLLLLLLVAQPTMQLRRQVGWLGRGLWQGLPCSEACGTLCPRACLLQLLLPLLPDDAALNTALPTAGNGAGPCCRDQAAVWHSHRGGPLLRRLLLTDGGWQQWRSGPSMRPVAATR